MSQTRAYLHFKQALVLIEEQLLYISLNVSHAEGSKLPANTAAIEAMLPTKQPVLLKHFSSAVQNIL